MSKKTRLMVVIALGFACTLLSFGSSMALDFSGGSYFNVRITGPVLVTVTAPNLTLDVTVTNERRDTDWSDPDNPRPLPKILQSLQILVIDPISGARVAGPQTITVQSMFIYQQTITRQITVAIPMRPYRNKTLAAIIVAVDNEDVVRGSAGWGFVTN